MRSPYVIYVTESGRPKCIECNGSGKRPWDFSAGHSQARRACEHCKGVGEEPGALLGLSDIRFLHTRTFDSDKPDACGYCGQKYQCHTNLAFEEVDRLQTLVTALERVVVEGTLLLESAPGTQRRQLFENSLRVMINRVPGPRPEVHKHG